jgi:hypothetical protein
VIRAAYLGHDLGDLTALENPRSVEGIRKAIKAVPTEGQKVDRPMPIEGVKI